MTAIHSPESQRNNRHDDGDVFSDAQSSRCALCRRKALANPDQTLATAAKLKEKAADAASN
jgi:hypothetical protein